MQDTLKNADSSLLLHSASINYHDLYHFSTYLDCIFTSWNKGDGLVRPLARPPSVSIAFKQVDDLAS